MIDTNLWSGVEDAEVSVNGLNEPSSPYSLNLYGTDNGGSKIRSAMIDTSDLTEIKIEYQYQRTGNGDSPESGEDLIVEYFSSSSNWVELTRHQGSVSDMTSFEFVTNSLATPDVFHNRFRVQFRVDSSDVGLDDWFIDGIANGSARTVGGLSAVLKRIQTGYVQHYVVWMLVGIVILIAYYLFR